MQKRQFVLTILAIAIFFAGYHSSTIAVYLSKNETITGALAVLLLLFIVSNFFLLERLRNERSSSQDYRHQLEMEEIQNRQYYKEIEELKKQLKPKKSRKKHG